MASAKGESRGGQGSRPRLGGPDKESPLPLVVPLTGAAVLFGPGLAYLRLGPPGAGRCGAEGDSPQTTPSAVLSGGWAPGSLGPSGGDAGERLPRSVGSRGRGLALFFLCLRWRYCCPWQTERERALALEGSSV